MKRLGLTLDADQRFVSGAIALTTLLLFSYSSLRHFLLRSTAYDLGFFDSALYRLSQGYSPLDTLHNTHILGDHAAWIVYPIALLYWLTPNVHWLFGLQALGLALGAVPVWWLAKHHYQLKSAYVRVLVLAYLLYPVVFNINLFDFHTDVFAPVLLLSAIAAVYGQCLWGFLLALVLLCGCKGVFGLTIVGLGAWLCLGERRYRYGAIALIIGIAWFLIANYGIVAALSDGTEKGIGRYAFLGESLTEVALNLVLKPNVVLQQLLTLANLKYLLLLFIPVAWGFSPRVLSPLIGVIPNLVLNLLASDATQKDLNFQYSLPILPFLIVMVGMALQQQVTWLRRPRWLISWLVVVFLVLGKVEYFALRYFDEGFNTIAASREAIALMHPTAPVLVPSRIVPQVTHRLKVQMIVTGAENLDLAPYHNVFLDTEVPAIHTQPETIPNLLNRLKNEPDFNLVFNRDNVFLFEKRVQE
ncbi:MAG: DUF2079 domain-containing protein [Spirulina sp. SIO3F2]|nr:DUF2079 domain-containing protein [Spirulina sp. SIO3F2]